jgi:hypothetical protein
MPLNYVLFTYKLTMNHMMFIQSLISDFCFYRGGCEILDTTTPTTITTNTTTDLATNATVTEAEVEEIVVPDGTRLGARRSGRMIFDTAPLTRTGFLPPISIGDLSILSLGTGKTMLKHIYAFGVYS